MGRRRTRPVSATARSFKELEDWPPETLAYLLAAFRRKKLGAGPTWQKLLAEIKENFGREWNDSSLSRYYAYWESYLYPLDRAEEQARELMDRLKEYPSAEIEEQIRQSLTALRLLSLRDLEGADPVKVARLGIQTDRLKLANKKLGLDEERKRIQEEKLALERDRLAFDKERSAQRAATDLEHALEFWETVLGLVHAADGQAGAALTAVADRVIDGLKAKYAAA